MKIVTASGILLLVSSVSIAQQTPVPATGPAQSAPPAAWLDRPRISTVSVGRVLTDENTHQQFFAVVGTAVIIALGEHTGYIVTAKHVFFETAKNWHPNELRLRFAWQEDKSVFDELGVPLALRDASGKDLWKSLDDGSDLAAIAPPADIKSKSVQAIWTNEFATEADLYVLPQLELERAFFR
jgi:hypothetical protein